MKKFEFKLQKLLEIRQKNEDEARVALAKASGEYQFEVQKKERILTNVKNYRQSAINPDGSLSLSQLKSYDAYQKSSEFAIADLENIIEEKRLVMEKKMKKYTEMKQKKRSVEIIKEKALAKHLEETAKEEQQTNDEIGQSLFFKHKGTQ